MRVNGNLVYHKFQLGWIIGNGDGIGVTKHINQNLDKGHIS